MRACLVSDASSETRQSLSRLGTTNEVDAPLRSLRHRGKYCERPIVGSLRFIAGIGANRALMCWSVLAAAGSFFLPHLLQSNIYGTTRDQAAR